MTAELKFRVPDVFWMTATEGWDYSVVSSGAVALASFYPYVIEGTDQVRGDSPESPMCRLRRITIHEATYVVTLMGFYDASRKDQFGRPIYHLLFVTQPEVEWNQQQVQPDIFVRRYFETVGISVDVLAEPTLSLESLKAQVAGCHGALFVVPTEHSGSLGTRWLSPVEKKPSSAPATRGMHDQSNNRKFPMAVVATCVMLLVLIIKWFTGCLT
jgi:hypothetical protein